MRSAVVAFVVVALAALVLCAFAPSGATAEDTVLVELRNNTHLTQFSSSLNSSVVSVRRLGNATLITTAFAPIDANTPFNLTSGVVAYHLTAGRPALTDGQLLPSLHFVHALGGYQQLKVAISSVNNTVTINNVTVLTTITATNGAISVLSRPLSLPPALNTQAEQLFPTFDHLLATASMPIPAMKVTLFVPTETAFETLKATQPALFGYLASGVNESLTDLKHVLQYHVLPQTVLYTTNITTPRTIMTLNGQNVTIAKGVDNNVTVSGASGSAHVVDYNILAANGVMHGIDSVLVPNGFVFNLRKILIGLDDMTFLGLLEQANLTNCLIENCNYTIFAPTQEAWKAADKDAYTKNSGQLLNVLQSHICSYAVAIPHNATFPNSTFHLNVTMLNNKTMTINGGNITLVGMTKLPTAHLLSNGAGIQGSNGIVYAIDRVLGVADDTGVTHNKKLIGWIIVGTMGGVLLLAAIVVAIVWFVKRKRSTYEVISAPVV